MPNPTQSVETPLTQLAAAEAPTPAGTPQPTPAEGVTDNRSTTPEAARAEFAAAGRRVGRYEVVAELASGGMGVVYEAADPQVNRRVALKMIRGGVFAGAEEVTRFHREAQALAQLNHPHIIQVYDFGEVEGRPYFTMQLAAGGSLAGHMPRFGGDARAAVALIEKVARAVQHAHERGILHRDLKPANVLLGAGDEPLVSDFGLVKFLHAEGEGLTQTGLTPGTPAYMAPEQAIGRKDAVSPRTDVWALGVILYELLGGRRPFTGGSREEILHHILTEPVPPPRERRPDIDPALEAVVMKCLAKEPGQRYATAGELADDLGRWLRGELRPSPVTPPTRLNSGPRRRPLRTVLIAAGIVAALGGAFVVIKSFPPSPPQAKEPVRESPLVLVDAQGLRGEVKWLVGEQSTNMEQKAGLYLRTTESAVLQLLESPPWESYRLEARVRHEAANRGTFGLYFGYTSCPSSLGPCHLRYDTDFADQGSHKGELSMNVGQTADDNSVLYAGVDCFRAYPLMGKAEAAPATPWRTLAVEVAPRQVKVFVDASMVRMLGAEDLRQTGLHLLKNPEGPSWQTISRGGIGISLDDGAATFEEVVLYPLEAHP